MQKISNYIDALFCCVILPMMIIIFPVERWFHYFPMYTICVAAWLYIVYFVNRRLICPLLFKKTFFRRLGGAMLVATVIVTYFISNIRLYEPKPHLFDMGITRYLPILEQYQQCIWSLFVIVEFFSIALTVIIEFASQRNQWLLKLIEENQIRGSLMEENTRLKRELEDSSKQGIPDDQIQLKAGYKNVPLKISEILLIEAMENYVKVYRKDKATIISQTSMKAVEELLADKGFVRVHRSYIASKQHIEKYGSKEILINGYAEPIPVGRKYSASVQDALSN